MSTSPNAVKVPGGGHPVQMLIQEPWYTLVKDGRKDVEGRAAHDGRWGQYEGETLEIRRTADDPEVVRARVEEVRHYDTLDDYLDAEWRRAAPHCATRDEAREAYLAVTMAGGVQVFSAERVSARGGMEAVELRVLEVA